jgi:succinate dehydrogenase/fumarate reductase-like Fe-S protein
MNRSLSQKDFFLTSALASNPRNNFVSFMRAFMYSEGYGNAVQASMTIAELPMDRGIEVCRSCDRCTPVCRNGIPVARRVDTLLAKGFAGA